MTAIPPRPGRFAPKKKKPPVKVDKTGLVINPLELKPKKKPPPKKAPPPKTPPFKGAAKPKAPPPKPKPVGISAGAGRSLPPDLLSAAAVAKAGRERKREQAARARQKAREEAQQAALFRRKGGKPAEPKKSKFAQQTMGVGGSFAKRFASDIVSAAEQLPTGIEQMSVHQYQDLADLARQGLPRVSILRKLGPRKKESFPTRTAKDVQQMGVQTWRYVDPTHPTRTVESWRRHPGYGALYLFGALSATGGGLARGARFAKAAKAEGLKTAAKGVSKPIEAGTIELAPGVRKPLSRHPVVRAGQKARVAARRAEGKPSRLGLSPEDTVGRAARATRRIESDIAQAPAVHVSRLTSKLKGPEHTALSVVGIEGNEALLKPRETIARHVSTHEANIPLLEQEIAALKVELKNRELPWYEKAKISGQIQDLRRGIERNKQRAADLREALPVLENPRPEFTAAVEGTRSALKVSEQETIRRGRLTPEQATGRQAKMAAAYQRTWASGERPRTVEEAKARLGTLEKATKKPFAEMVDRLYESNPEAFRMASAATKRAGKKPARAVPASEMERFRGGQPNLPKMGGKAQPTEGTGYLGAARSPRALAEAEVLKRLRASNDPTAQAFVAAIDEAGQLRASIADFESPAWAQEGSALGTQRTFSMSEMQPGEAPPGSFYFPMSQKYTQTFEHLRGLRAPEPRVQYLTKPTPGRFISGLGKPFTGRSVELGGPGRRVGEHIADTISARARLASAEDFYTKTLIPLSSDVRMTNQQVPLPVSTAARKNLLRAQSQAEDAAVYGDQVAVNQAITDAFSPSRILRGGEEVDARSIPLGERVEGYRWVDRRYVKQMQAGMSGPTAATVERVVNAINRPVRFGTVYIRPAYMVNKVQNQIMGAIRTGHRWPAAVRDAHRLDELIGPEATAWVDAGVGTTRSQSYIAGQAKVGALTRKIETWWQRVTDQNERRASFIAEARRKGYETPEDWLRLRESADPAVVADRVEIFQRARRNMVDFDSMTPLEQKLSIAIFFYPWMSRGSMWALQTPIENAVKTAALAGLSEHAKSTELPWYLAGDIAFRHAGKLFLSNPQSVNTFQTATEVAKGVQGSLEGMLGLGLGRENIGQMLSPVAQLLSSGLSEPQAGQPVGLPALIQSTAPAAALKRGGVWGKPGKLFPTQSAAEALLPFAFGGMWPRQASEKQIAKALRAEMTLEERALADQKALWSQFRKASPSDATPQLKREFTQAYTFKLEREKTLDAARMRYSGAEYQKEAAKREADLLLKWKFITQQDYNSLTGDLGQGPDVVKEIRNEMHDVFDEVYLSVIRDVKQAANG